MRTKFTAAAVCAALLAGSGAAQGAVLTRTFNFSMEITPRLNVVTPFDPFEGSFTVTWDNSLDYLTDQTAGLVVHSLSAPVGSVMAFVYRSDIDALFLGGVDASDAPGDGVATYHASGIPDLLLPIIGASTDTPATPPPYFATYTVAYVQGRFASSNVTITVSDAPEPSAWALMILGFGGLGAALRRGRARMGARAA